MIRKVTVNDLLQIAKIHKEQFPDHYLGKFSEKLINLFYYEFLKANTLFLIHESDNGEISGFVLGCFSNDIDSISSLFTRNNKWLCAKEIIVTPATWKKSFIKIAKSFSFNSKAEQENKYSLLSIAVSKKKQGKGVAEELIKAFDLGVSNHSNFYTLTVFTKNKRAVHFYEKVGMKIDKSRKSTNYTYFRKDI